MRIAGAVILFALTALPGCSKSNASPIKPKTDLPIQSTALPTIATETTLELPAPEVHMQITDAALPVLRSAMASAKKGDAVIYSMTWPAGYCSKQHQLEIGRPKRTDQTIMVSGIPIAFPAKYGKFVSGTVIDYGTRGSESGLKLKNDTLDMYSIIHSESDSALMIEMLGDGFEDYRDAVLEGKIILKPASTTE